MVNNSVFLREILLKQLFSSEKNKYYHNWQSTKDRLNSRYLLHVNNLEMVSKGTYYTNVMKFPKETYFNEILTFDCYFVTTYNNAFSNIIRRTPFYFYTIAACIINSQVSRF